MAKKLNLNTTKNITKEKMTEKKIDKITRDTGEVLGKNGKIKVKIPKMEGSTEKQIECGINGYNYILKRGATVDIPIDVYEVLHIAGII